MIKDAFNDPRLIPIDEKLATKSVECAHKEDQGLVSATNIRFVREKYVKSDNWKFLPNGETINVPAGSAYFIKSQNDWYLAQFFEDGSMTGPLLFSPTDIEEPEVAYRQSIKACDREAFLFIPVTLLPLLFIFMIVVLCNPKQSGVVEVEPIVAFFLTLVGLILTAKKLHFEFLARFYDKKLALKVMKMDFIKQHSTACEIPKPYGIFHEAVKNDETKT